MCVCVFNIFSIFSVSKTRLTTKKKIKKKYNTTLGSSAGESFSAIISKNIRSLSLSVIIHVSAFIFNYSGAADAGTLY